MKGLIARSRLCSASLVAAVLIGLPFSSSFAQLTLSIDQLSPTGAPGDVLDFTGVITNQTGYSLDSTDLFLNFFNYDPNSLNPLQIVGSTEFTLPDNTYSADTDLFSVAITPGIGAGPQTLSVELGDAYGDLSNEVDLSVTVTGSPVVQAPELDAFGTAGALTLLFGILGCLGVFGKRSDLANGVTG